MEKKDEKEFLDSIESFLQEEARSFVFWATNRKKQWNAGLLVLKARLLNRQLLGQETKPTTTVMFLKTHK